MGKIKSVLPKMITEQLVQIRNKQQECLTINLLASILWKDRNVLTLYHEHSLVEVNNCTLLRLHKNVSNIAALESFRMITGILQELLLLPELPAVIDVGILKDSFEDVHRITKESLIAKLWYGHLSNTPEQKDVVLCGFGPTARFLALEMCEDKATRVKLNLRAIVIKEHVGVEEFNKMASLIDNTGDGRQGSIVEIDENHQGLIINGHFVYVIHTKDTGEVNYRNYGIDGAILIDTWVRYSGKQSLEQHLNCPGIAKVILAGSCRDIPHIIFGVNHDLASSIDSNLYAASSSSSNAIAPVINILENKYGIIKGHIQYICHANDQDHLTDVYQHSEKRYNLKDLNDIITEEKDAGIPAEIFPSLSGRLTSNAIRVPIFKGSLAILVLEMKKKITLENINEFFRMSTAAHNKSKLLDISYDNNFDSHYFLRGNSAVAVIEGRSTKVSFDGSMLTLYVWYDKDYSYSRQIINLASTLETKVRSKLKNREDAFCYN